MHHQRNNGVTFGEAIVAFHVGKHVDQLNGGNMLGHRLYDCDSPLGRVTMHVTMIVPVDGRRSCLG
jgi:hypothetical protein